MGTGVFTAGCKPCNGLASHSGGSTITPSRFMLNNLGKAPPALMGHLAHLLLFSETCELCSSQQLLRSAFFVAVNHNW